MMIKRRFLSHASALLQRRAATRSSARSGASPSAHSYERLLHDPSLQAMPSALTLIPSFIQKPPYALLGKAFDPPPRQLVLKSPDDIKRMRESGRLAAEALSYAQTLLEPGLTTIELDRKVREWILKEGAYPSPLNYHGFPHSICTSVNNVICHGIPDKRPLQTGDLISIDITVYKNGFHGDTCRTFLVDAEGLSLDDRRAALALMQATSEALSAAIETIGPNQPVTEVGRVIGRVADRYGFGNVREFCGHGIGRDFHELPYVYHYPNRQDSTLLEPGMTFTIEPMFCEGRAALDRWPDEWTIVTKDGGRCAQFEHTLVMTEHGMEILTAYP